MLSGSEIAGSLFTLACFMVSVGLVYILLPWIALRGQVDLAPVERFWCAFLFGSAYWVAVVLLLAPFHFHDVPGLLVVTLALILAYLAFVGHVDIVAEATDAYHNFIRLFLDFVEDRETVVSRFLALTAKGARELGRKLLGTWEYPRILIYVVFAYGAYLRLYDSVTHYSYGFFDPYVHIVWLKQLNRGDVFADGVYPRGYHAFLSAIGTFTTLEPAVLVRFAGGVIGSLLPPALYFFLLQCRVPWSGALLGTALVAIASPYEYMMERQTASLPQEFAIVFTLLALSFAVRYLRFGYPRDRWAFFCGGFVVWCAHTLVGAAMMLAGIALGIDYFARREKSIGRFLRIAREGILCTIAGNLDLIVGRLLGYPFHAASLEYVERVNAAVSGNSPGLTTIDVGNILRDELGNLDLVMLVFAVPLAIFGLARRRERFPSPALPAVWSLELFAIWALRRLLEVNTLVPTDRAQIFLDIAVCGVVGWLYVFVVEPLMGGWLKNVRVRVGCVFLVLVGIAWAYYTPPPEPVHPQYEEDARLYYQLAGALPPGSWTVVGQAEDYELNLNRGYHITVPRFLSNYPPYLKQLRLSTPYTYIVVEKKPKLDPDSDQLRERAVEESLLADWVKLYAIHHRDLHLYSETDNVAIYVIYYPEATRERDRSGATPD